MNFYSQEIMDNIIDNTELENIIEKLDHFNKNVEYLLCNYSNRELEYKYIKRLLEDKQNKIAFYCIDFEFNIYNCPSMLIYTLEHLKWDNFMLFQKK